MDEKESFKVKLIDILLSFKVWILIFFIIFSFVAVSYTTDRTGVVINGVVPGSIAADSGINFNSELTPRNFEKILYINNKKIENEDDYYFVINGLDFNSDLNIITDKNSKGYNIDLSVLKNKNISVVDALGISIRDPVSSNIKLGIELEGGSRLILKPSTNLTNDEFDILINNLQSRLDVYGASGTKVNKLEDAFSNEKFVIVESISANKNDIYELISRQGKFVATVSNKTAFTGDNVLKVLTDPQHARLEGCNPNSDNLYVCTYSFVTEIDVNGTNNFFNLTSNLATRGGYLSKKVCFNLDGKEITCLNIASSFKYQKISSPQISVSGNPAVTRKAAIESAKKEMKFLQTVLSTQSLSTDLEVVQSYAISSSQGKKILNNALLVGLTALLLVAGTVALRYRHFTIFGGIFIALISEVIIVFGIAAFMRLSIDLAAIGGLIAAIGTGVDDQIIITDEYFRKRNKKITSKNRVKSAMFIIMISYLTTVAAMIPLYFAGLKVLQGFAFMIIIGVSVGVFITRPAYASILRIIMTTRRQREEEAEKDK